MQKKNRIYLFQIPSSYKARLDLWKQEPGPLALGFLQALACRQAFLFLLSLDLQSFNSYLAKWMPHRTSSVWPGLWTLGFSSSNCRWPINNNWWVISLPLSFCFPMYKTRGFLEVLSGVHDAWPRILCLSDWNPLQLKTTAVGLLKQ